MLGLAMTFLKGNAMKIGIGLLITVLITGGGWFMKNKYDKMELELRQSTAVIAIVTNEYEDALRVAEANSKAFAEYRAAIKKLDKLMQAKHIEDNAREDGIAYIKEGIRHADMDEDDSVSDVIRGTIDGIRVLRQNGDSKSPKLD